MNGDKPKILIDTISKLPKNHKEFPRTKSPNLYSFLRKEYILRGLWCTECGVTWKFGRHWNNSQWREVGRMHDLCGDPAVVCPSTAAGTHSFSSVLHNRCLTVDDRKLLCSWSRWDQEIIWNTNHFHKVM